MEQLSQEKADAFVKDYRELVAKHEVDFATYPVYVPDGTGAFKVIIQNTPVHTPKLTESPKEFVEKE